MFFKESVLKQFHKIQRKTPCWSLFFNKVLALRPATLLKKRLQQRCFPVNFVKFLRTPFLQNTSQQLPLFVVNSSHSFNLQRSFIYLFKPFFVRKIDKNSQFSHHFIFQIHFILYIVNAFYRSKHKYKK